MKIFDTHIHTETDEISPEKIIKEMNSIGVYGGAIISPQCKTPLGFGYSYEERMHYLKKWTQGYDNRFFPILWIHPLEENAIEKARDAVSRGVKGFKIICDCFYVYDDASMKLLSEIAKMNKPVIFHSGILWDGYNSGKFNRPLNWECLIDIKGLKFSLAHCAWPWCDETIALYGKFLNAYSSNPSVSSEMFLDLTPGTPVIYRKELINKIYNCGYDTPRNVLFGTDCTAHIYNTSWAKSWIECDSKIMSELGVSKRLQKYYFKDNFMRFMGVTEKNFTHVSPVPDCADAFSLKYANENY